MWTWWMACSLTAPSAPSASELTTWLAADDWERSGCSRVRSEGVSTHTCTFRRAEVVNVVTTLLYDQADDAERMWSAAHAVGWQEGPLVVQIDVFDEGAARKLLDTLPPGRPPSFRCTGDICQRGQGHQLLLWSDRPPSDGSVGYLFDGQRTVAVQDLAIAREVRQRLRGAMGLP